MRASAIAAILAGLALSGGAQAASPCNRACLTGVLDSYLAGVIRHDAAQAPLAAGYRETENAVDVKAGDGLWSTLTGLGEVQRRYLDTTNGAAAYFGTISEAGGGRGVVSLRIKVENRKVAEAEWIIARQGEALFNPDNLIAQAPPEGPIPAAERASRADLERAANSYFEGLQTKNGETVIHQPGCVRLENGTRVTQRQAPAGANTGETNEFGANDCASGFDRFQIRAVAHRRFPVIDEVQGVALGYGMFLRPPGARSQRLLLSEVFTTKGGKITGIYAAMHYLPSEAPETMGWPDERP